MGICTDISSIFPFVRLQVSEQSVQVHIFGMPSHWRCCQSAYCGTPYNFLGNILLMTVADELLLYDLYINVL